MAGCWPPCRFGETNVTGVRQARQQAARRKLLYQAVLLLLVAMIAFSVFHATQANLERLGVHSGFDFLWLRAGFEIGQSLIDYTPDSPVYVALIVAFLNTLLLALVSIVCATVLGFVIGIFRLSRNWLLSHLAQAYVEAFRNVPALLQVFLWYFVVLGTLPDIRHSYRIVDGIFLNNRGLYFPAPELSPEAWLVLAAVLLVFVTAWAVGRLTAWGRSAGRKKRLMHYLRIIAAGGLVLLLIWPRGQWLSWVKPELARFNYEGGFSLSPEFVALAVGLSVYNASYIAEIVRSAFQSVPTGMKEAGHALGLRPGQTTRLIVLPLAVRVIVPPLTTVYLNLFKSTSLAAAIAYPDIMSVFVGTVNNLIGQPLEIMAATLLIYALVSFAMSLAMCYYERKFRLRSG